MKTRIFWLVPALVVGGIALATAAKTAQNRVENGFSVGQAKASDVAPVPVPHCSATLRDNCDQGS